jgi:hypothetical protein
MTPRRTTVDQTKGVLEVDWPLFGELSRALALKVARDWQPDLVLGVATAGVIPGATVAAILDRPFQSIAVSRRYRTDDGDHPVVLHGAPAEVQDRLVLVVDETCDSGETLRLAKAAVQEAGAREVRTAVGFRTGYYEPDYHALATEATIVLPWDREILLSGELVTNPVYSEALRSR